MQIHDFPTEPTDRNPLRRLSAFLIIYAVIFVVELTAEVLFSRIPLLLYITKPLITLSLGGYYLYLTRFRRGLYDTLVMMALFFSLCGDVLLMLGGTGRFLAGIGAFLIAHVCYISVFSLNFSRQSVRPVSVFLLKPWLILPLLIYVGLLIYRIYGGAGEFLIPVLVYSCVIFFMVVSAINRWGRTSLISYTLVVTGAILFMLSDSLIAINRFSTHDLPAIFFDWGVMSTYMLAQLMIIWGILVERKQPLPQDPQMN